MRLLVLAAVALGLPALALAEPARTRTICVEGDGGSAAALCQSREPDRDDICFCGTGAKEVTAPVCGPGERPPGESRSFRQARVAALKHSHTLVGVLYEGKPMCVESAARGTR